MRGGELEFSRKIGRKERRIVTPQQQRYPGIPKLPQRMERKTGRCPGADIARGTDLERNVAPGQFRHQCRILNGPDAMTNAFSANLDRVPDARSGRGLAGMACQTQPVSSRLPVQISEPDFRPSRFVAANTDGNDALLTVGSCQFKNRRGRFRTELPDRIENPEDFHIRLLPGGSSNGFKDGVEVLLLPEDDPDRDGDFRVDDVLNRQPLQQAARGQKIRVRRSEPAVDPDVSFDEAGKITVTVVAANLLYGQRGIDFMKRIRRYGPFEMDMQFCFGKTADEVAIQNILPAIINLR
jgi:hypothetical protein